MSNAAQGRGWLIDIWGQPHPVAGETTVVGRLLSRGFAILQPSVSRQHAELSRGPDGWLVRDFDSKNGTFVRGARIRGSCRLAHGDSLQFGSVPFYFLARADALTVRDGRSILTESAIDCRFQSWLLRNPDGPQALRLVEVKGGGVLLFRSEPTREWSEMNLAPLESELLRVLAEQRRGARLEVEANVMTKELAARLSFRSQYANEENVRQVVKRLRVLLRQLGVDDLIRSLPRRGYSLAWSVEEDRSAREPPDSKRSAS